MTAPPRPGSVLGRVDQVLAVFDADHPSLSLTGLMARTGMPKTTAYRIASTMVTVGWLVRRDGRYHLGDRMFELAGPCRINTELRAPARPFLQDLVSATHETVHLAVLDGTDVLYADKIDGRWPISSPSRIGGRLPAHCTALGKVLIAYSGDEPKQRLLSTRLTARTPATIVDRARLTLELNRIAQAGLAFDHGEANPGLACVAAPVMVGDRCVAAVSVSASPSRLAPKRITTPLQRTVARIVRRVTSHPHAQSRTSLQVAQSSRRRDDSLPSSSNPSSR